MPDTKLGVLLRILNGSIVVAVLVLVATRDKTCTELAGLILSVALVWIWPTLLTAKVAMDRLRILSRVLGKPVTRSDRIIAVIGSLIVGPILGFLFVTILGFLFITILEALLERFS